MWGWAQGNVKATRIDKQRQADDALFVRNPDSHARLWRVSASRLRPFTAREYARLQTFPDMWEFTGQNKREVQLQIGNAVPVEFAKRIAMSVTEALEVLDGRRTRQNGMVELMLFPTEKASCAQGADLKAVERL